MNIPCIGLLLDC